MGENLTIKDKILAFLKYKGIKKVDFYESTGIEASNFKGKNRFSQPGGDMLVKILTMYPDLSANWLLTGEGPMLKEDCKPVAHECKNPKEGIPLIPIHAMAGALTGLQNSVLEYECERYVVPAFAGADFLIPVKGNSMSPTYVSGDIVACKRVPMDGLFLQWNKSYVLDTAQGALIKRIKPGSDTQHILIVSDNKEYDAFELPYSDIFAVALVMGIIRIE